MEKQVVFLDRDELAQYKERITKNLQQAKIQLQKLLETCSEFELFEKFKFDKTVPDSLTGDPENLIEVINQNQTYIVSLRAMEYLFNCHPSQTFKLNLGNLPGYDIESLDGTIICECFAATSYQSNNKLNKDLARLYQNSSALIKYQFFYDRKFTDVVGRNMERKYPGIHIVRFWKLEL